MRIILFFLAAVFFSAGHAQTVAPFDRVGYSQSVDGVSAVHENGFTARKWFFSANQGVSSGISFFNRGNFIMVGAPVGFQLNRRLNSNLYGFANISLVPVYASFNQPFTGVTGNKRYGYNMQGINGSFAYPVVSMGLMYSNEQRTFSISGSISAERQYYPVLPYYPAGVSRQGFGNVPHAR